jgi:signal transduction histidine kinase
MGTRRTRPRRSVAWFVVLGVGAFLLVSVAGIFSIRQIARREALGEAEQLAEVDGRIVQRRLLDGLLTGDADATAAIGAVAFDAVLLEPVVGISLRTAEGDVLYADDPSRIGSIEPIDPEGSAALATGQITMQEQGDVLSAADALRTPNGTPVLFQILIRRSAIEASERAVFDTFVPWLIASLFAFALLAGLITWGATRRMVAAASERAILLQRVVDAEDRERRRIAADLHDGPVQELAGVAMQLAARSESVSDDAAKGSLRSAAEVVRSSVRTLRSVIVGVYPPSLRQAGLGPALSDLAAHLEQEGITVRIDVDRPRGYVPHVDDLIYRVSREALRNVASHAHASHVELRVRQHGSTVILEITDDGVGMEEIADRAGGDGSHLGLQIVRDLVVDAGGSLDVRRASADGGTVTRMEVAVR